MPIIKESDIATKMLTFIVFLEQCIKGQNPHHEIIVGRRFSYAKFPPPSDWSSCQVATERVVGFNQSEEHTKQITIYMYLTITIY